MSDLPPAVKMDACFVGRTLMEAVPPDYRHVTVLVPIKPGPSILLASDPMSDEAILAVLREAADRLDAGQTFGEFTLKQ